MKQIIHNFSNGKIEMVDTVSPNISENDVLIQSTVSLISTGTEKMLIEFGQSNFINKIKKQPDKVKQVLNKIKTDGLSSTYNAVKNKLNNPISLGYSSVGIVIDIGSNVKEFQVGDRVLSNGVHAEIVSVNKNLCVRIDNDIDDKSAVFGILGSIALEGIRLGKEEMVATVRTKQRVILGRTLR